MKKTLIGSLTLILIIGLFGCANRTGGKGSVESAMPSGPTVVMGTPRVPLDNEAEAVIKGAGFQPGQEIFLLITDANGIQSDIEYALNPIPKADAAGAWSTTWSCGRYVKKKLVKEGAYVITAVNTKYEPLASAPVTFYKAK